MLLGILDIEPGLLAARPGQVLIVDKGYRNAQTEAVLAARGLRCRARPTPTSRPARRWPAQVGPPADRVGKRHLKGQLDLERHGGRSFEGVAIRVLQRLLAMTAAIWHNHKTSQPVLRSLVAYDNYS